MTRTDVYGKLIQAIAATKALADAREVARLSQKTIREFEDEAYKSGVVIYGGIASHAIGGEVIISCNTQLELFEKLAERMLSENKDFAA